MSLKGSDTSPLFPKRTLQAHARIRLTDSLPMADTRSEKLCASSGISSPPETVRQVQENQVELWGLTVLELILIPDINGRKSSRLAQKSARIFSRHAVSHRRRSALSPAYLASRL